MKKLIIPMAIAFSSASSVLAESKNFAYIYGDISEAGAIPSGSATPYDPMRLNDTGDTGISTFRDLVFTAGHTITEHYDATTTFDTAFFDQYDAIVFGLHQELLTVDEKAAMDAWIRAGGSVMFYSDSAAGGKYSVVGAQNNTGQTAVNNKFADYGMQVLVDQGGKNGGIPVIQSGTSYSHPIITENLIIKGEGVSPVVLDANDPNYNDFEVLIPYTNDPTYIISGNANLTHLEGMTIANPMYAALAVKNVDDGHIIGLFDRQPMWNNGVGANIETFKNKLILENVIKFMAGDLDASEGDDTLVIEAEDFDYYADSTSNNIGGDYRQNAVDIKAWGGDNYFVGWISPNEHLEYEIDVAAAGDYDFSFQVASGFSGNKSFRLESNGVDLSGTVTFDTGGAGWTAWQTVDVSGVALPAGPQILRVVMLSHAFNIDSFSISGSSVSGEILTDVGVSILANTYDSESNPENQFIVQDQGTKVGYIKDGSWISYSDFNFGASGNIRATSIDISASCGNVGGNIEVRMASPTGTLLATVPITNTTGWNTFQTFSEDFALIPSGTHDLYFVFTGGSGSLLDVQSFTLNPTSF